MNSLIFQSGPDPLRVLASCQPVVERAAWVRVDPQAIQNFSRRALAHPVAEPEEDRLHMAFTPPERFYNYLLVLEALNFCFWDEEPRWTVQWGGQPHDGYWALAAALRRGVEEDGLKIWDMEQVKALDEAALAHLLRGQGRPIPLLAERLHNLREAAAKLLGRWGGDFRNMALEAQGSAPRLAALIAEGIPSFQDEAQYQGQPVRFFKRAQIAAADLARLGPPDAPRQGLDQLTAFADYKLPQVLRREGVLVYAPALAAKLGQRQELPEGSPEEVEIRAATLWSCHWIAQTMSQLKGQPVTAMEVDYQLWVAGQDKTGLAPYHRTRTIYY